MLPQIEALPCRPTSPLVPVLTWMSGLPWRLIVSCPITPSSASIVAPVRGEALTAVRRTTPLSVPVETRVTGAAPLPGVTR
jgi:hypothetical protein